MFPHVVVGGKRVKSFERGCPNQFRDWNHSERKKPSSTSFFLKARNSPFRVTYWSQYPSLIKQTVLKPFTSALGPQVTRLRTP
jgi:hypothetical protein